MSLSSNEVEIARNATILRGLDDEALKLVLDSANIKELEDGAFFSL